MWLNSSFNLEWFYWSPTLFQMQCWDGKHQSMRLGDGNNCNLCRQVILQNIHCTEIASGKDAHLKVLAEVNELSCLYYQRKREAIKHWNLYEWSLNHFHWSSLILRPLAIYTIIFLHSTVMWGRKGRSLPKKMLWDTLTLICKFLGLKEWHQRYVSITNITVHNFPI